MIEIQGNDTGSVNLTVSGNDLDDFNQSGVNVVADDASDVVVDIDGNFIDTNQPDKIGIRSSIRNAGMSRLTIRNNQIGQTTACPAPSAPGPRNTLTNVGSGAAAEIVTDTAGAGTTLCLDLRSNTAVNPGPTTGVIELIRFEGTTYSVEDLADVVTNNPAANVVFDPPNLGAFSNSEGCPDSVESIGVRRY
ncbi:MAG TPA: hypothetical protein VMS56_11665 [Thermoanaerobaculia bacterium]|nr:hypothetical protein [Thermoanaerobaculia bacterium]